MFSLVIRLECYFRLIHSAHSLAIAFCEAHCGSLSQTPSRIDCVHAKDENVELALLFGAFSVVKEGGEDEAQFLDTFKLFLSSLYAYMEKQAAAIETRLLLRSFFSYVISDNPRDIVEYLHYILHSPPIKPSNLRISNTLSVKQDSIKAELYAMLLAILF